MSCFCNLVPGGLYALGGYAHFTASVELSRYRKAVRDGCASLHKISASAHKPGLVHLYEAVMALERRCVKLEDVADSQLRAMGTNEEFAAVWHDVDLNLFSPERVKLSGLKSAGRRSPKPKQSIKTVPRGPVTTPTPITNNMITRSTSEVQTPGDLVTLALVDDLGSHLPAFMDEAYQRYCRSQSMPGEVCCSTDLFKFPVAKTIEEIKGCDMIILPEYVADSPYYNPLFFTELDFTAFTKNSSVEHLRDIYMAGGAVRGKRFLAALSIAGGFLLGAADDKVLGFFRYSHSTVEEVKHINENQQHLMQLEKYVEAAEKFA